MGNSTSVSSVDRALRPVTVSFLQHAVVHPQLRVKGDLRISLVVADGGMRLAAEAVRVRLGGRVLLCQHQLLVSLVVPDLVLVVVDEKFAAVILIRAGGNGVARAARALGHADATIVAVQTVLANGDVGAPHQIHIAGSTVLCDRVPRDGRRVGHGEGGVIVDKHTVAGVAADLAVVHVEGAG